MKILVIIVSYNSMKWIKTCYDSLRNSTVQCDVITIDNGSTDGTQAYLRQHYPEVEVIETGTNLGFGRANNIGLQKAWDDGYDYAYLLNQDAWVMPDTIEKLIEISKQDESYGILSPMQMQANLNCLDSNFRQWVLPNAILDGKYLVDDLYSNHIKDVYQVPCVMAAHWLVTRKCIEVVGGFSPTFPHYGEDDNYAHRVLYWDMKIGIVPSAISVHDRENRPSSEEKLLYITKYIQALDNASNPLKSVSIKNYIKAYLVQYTKTRTPWMWTYGIRLFKERKLINQNFALSLNKHAFLK